ncbi:hypothetical protein IQ07DRAFT_190278 [Pyrenochaeta sp. DS3sAY3a]|nr:hypothetical protein IQ07DRAFT_190278 [Pyrenochaeta sp. DS3sAY3a]
MHIKSITIVLLLCQPPMEIGSALLVASIVVSMLPMDSLSTAPCSSPTYKVSRAFGRLEGKPKCQRSRSLAPIIS